MLANSTKVLAKLPSVGSISRQMSVLSGPPQVRISLAEKAIHGIAIVVGTMTVPAWVLVNIKNYRARD